MGNFLKRRVLSILMAAGLSIQLFGAKTSLTTTNVCELAADPERYAKTMVRVRAFIISDLIHHTILADAGCEKVGVSLESEEWDGRPIDVIKDESYKTMEALHPKLIELRDRGQRLYGTFEGRFEWTRNGNPMKVLVLHRVSDLYVGQRDDPKYASHDKH